MHKLIEGIAVASALIGATLAALSYALAGYCIMVAGSCGLCYAGIKAKNPAQVVLHGSFFCVNIVGLLTNWG